MRVFAHSLIAEPPNARPLNARHAFARVLLRIAPVALCIWVALGCAVRTLSQPPLVTPVPFTDMPVDEATDGEPAAVSPPIDDGQSNETTLGDTTTPESKPTIKLGPDTFLLPDADGNLQPVLNLTYEQLLAALETQQGGDASRPGATSPRYEMEAIHATGRIADSFVAINCRYTIRLMTDELVEIPLGVAAAPLTKTPTANPPFKSMTYDAERGGYVARCQGVEGDTLEIAVDALLPLRQLESGTTLRANFPRALKSSLVLVAKSRLEQVEATTGVVVETSFVAGGATRIEATGIAGDLQLSWRLPAVKGNQLESVLSVAGGIRATIDGRSVRSEAQLLVQSYSGSFLNFKVRLPPNAKLESHSETGLIKSVVRDEEGEENAAGVEGEVWHVELEETEGPVSLTLSTEQPLGLSSDDSDQLIEFAGFEVLGALRQFGEIALEVDDNWQLRLDSSNGVQQIGRDQLSPDMANERVTSAFEYFRQPWSLKARLLRRDVRMTAEPSYRLLLEPEQIRMKITVDYSVASGRVSPLLFDLNGWQVAADLPTVTGLDNAQWEVYRDGTAGFPTAQPTAQQVRVSFWVTRDIPPEMLGKPQQLEFLLPSLVASEGLTVAASELSVVASDALEVTPEPDEMLGLVPQAREFNGDNDAEGLLTQQFEYRGFAPELKFAANVALRPGRTTVADTVTITLDADTARVAQDFRFDVRYQAIESLQFSIPPALATTELSVEMLRLGSKFAPGSDDELGVPLFYSVTAPSPDQADSSATAQPTSAASSIVDVDLGRLQRGEFRIRFAYRVPRSSMATEVVPVIVPQQVVRSAQRLFIGSETGESWQVATGTSSNDAWQRVDDASSAAESTTQYIAESPQTLIKLTKIEADTPQPGMTFVDQQWIQTWLASTQRQQRFVFAVRSDDTALRVELPVGVLADEVELTLDGQPVENQSTNNEQVEVPLDPGVALESHTLELRFRQVAPLASWFTTRVDSPRVLGDDSHVETYWQLVAPAGLMVIEHGRELTPDYDWKLTGSGWQPDSRIDTTELETQLGAVARRPPAEGENSFVFATHGSVGVYQATVAHRLWLVAIVSSVVLALILTLAYVSSLRQPAFLLPAILVGTIVGLAYPTMASIVGYAAVLGGILGIVGWMLRLALRPAARRPATTIRAGGSSLVSRPLGESYPLSLGSVVSSNAPTVSLPAGE